MLPHHLVLRDYAPLVKGYVLDARQVAPNAPYIVLTVLIDPETSWYIHRQIRSRLDAEMRGSVLDDILADFGLQADCCEPTTFIANVQHLRQPVQP